jgi:hypothetical protein
LDRETNTQVYEDLPDTVDLKTVIVSPTASTILTQSVAMAIGRRLGFWLRAFHTWASDTAQSRLRTEIARNEAMRKLKYDVTYGSFINVLENFPDVLGSDKGVRKTLEKARDTAATEFEQHPARNPHDEVEEDGWGIIHGDFWTGKCVLFCSPSSCQPEGSTSLTVLPLHHPVSLCQTHSLPLKEEENSSNSR